MSRNHDELRSHHGLSDLDLDERFDDPGDVFAVTPSGQADMLEAAPPPAPPSVIQLSALDGTNGFRFNGANFYDHSGWSVASAGDLNGDGFADAVIGAPYADAGNSDNGSIYVVFGKSGAFSSLLTTSQLNGTTGFRIDGISQSQNLGFSVATAGDVNGDGIDDLIIGAPAHFITSGGAYIVFGTTAGFPSSINLSTLDGGNGFKISDSTFADRAGTSVASAGDINGDGIDDVIVGGRGAGNYTGRSWVVFGKSDGPFNASIDVTALDGHNGFTLTAAAAGDQAAVVGSAGDFNADGIDDLLIGASNANGTGSAYVVYGTPSGFGATVALGSLTKATGFRIDGAPSSGFGHTVSALGDVNGDGYDDIFVGAYGGTNYVVFGTAAGFASPLKATALDGTNGFAIIGGGSQLGRTVHTAGDINGDGFADIIVGDPNATANLNRYAGISYVIFGHPVFQATFALSSLDGNNGFAIDGAAFNDRSGFSVSGAGDLNGDGFDDLIVGAENAYGSNGGHGSGASFVIFGHAAGNAAVVQVGSSGNDTLYGGGNADMLGGLGGNDVLKGFSGNDTLNGGDGNDTIIGGPGNDSLDGGNGVDTLDYSVGASPVSVDLLAGTASGPAIGADTLAGFENVNGGSGDDVLTGDGGNNLLSGGSGADKLNGGTADDTLLGGLGNDTLNGSNGADSLIGGDGADSLKGGQGDDTLDGGNGIDTASYADAHGGIVASLLSGTASGADIGSDTLTAIENLSGSTGADTLTGDAGANLLSGNNGNDVLDGNDANDTLDGGSGNDSLIGNTGDDLLLAGKGNDTLDGGDGSDTLVGGSGNDVLIGGSGIDVADYSAETAPVTVDLATGQARGTGIGKDTVSGIENVVGGSSNDVLTGDASANLLLGSSGNDVLAGGDGDDTLIGGTGNDVMNGGSGIDLADYSTDTAGIRVDLATGLATGAAIGTDSLQDVENVTAGAGDDALSGNNAANTFSGGAGNDTLNGGGGDDTLDGGTGINTADFSGDVLGVTVRLLTGTATGSATGVDSLRNIQNVTGGSGDDSLGGNAGNNLLSGAGGDDTLTGGGGDDTLDGGNGVDTADYGAETLALSANLAAGTASSTSIGNDHLTGIENVNGGSGADVLTGDANANALSGGDGNDTLMGGAGDDVLNGGNGLDTADYTSDGAGVNASLATGTASGSAAGNDLLVSIENLTGGTGNDLLSGNGASNVLSGGAGNDTLSGGAGSDTLIGGAGNDSLDGGDGIDTVDYSAEHQPITVNLATGTASGSTIGTDVLLGIENVIGSTDSSVLTGDGDANQLTGGNGSDVLSGGGGNDTLNGGAGLDRVDYSGDTTGVTVNLAAGTATGSAIGSDTLVSVENATGGDGNDRLTGDGNANQLSGGNGNDTLSGGAGDDTLTGGNGTDTADYGTDTAGLTASLVTGTATGTAIGSDRLSGIESITGGAGADTLHGDANANVLLGGAGNDVISGGAGNDTLDGGAGLDTLDYGSETAAVSVSLIDGAASGPSIGSDTVSGFEILAGGAGNDTLTGDNTDNTINGNAGDDDLTGLDGNDVLNGGSGNNTLDGGAGNDTLTGGAGDDVLCGGAGDDRLTGGDGIDTADYSADTSGIAASLAAGSATGALAGTDVLTGIENLTGGAGNDLLIGDGAANVLAGGDGGDTLEGLGGNDTLDGGGGIDLADSAESTAIAVNLLAGTAVSSAAGSDTLVGIENVSSGSGNDTLTGDGNANLLSGSSGDDALSGGDGNDTLDGGSGSNTFIGGGGADLLLGGAGHTDFFTFIAASDSTSSVYDTINGFDAKADFINVPVAVTGVDPTIKHGTLSTATFDADLAAAVTSATLAAGHAVVFTPNAGTLSGQTFLVVDLNGTAGYQAGQDLVIDLVAPLHLPALATGDFV